jgi:cytochrome c553
VSGRASLFLKALLAGLLLVPALPAHPQAAGPAKDDLAPIKPLLAKYCTSCHGDKPKPKADLDLKKYPTELSIQQNRKLWKQMAQMTAGHEMPPEEAKVKPTQTERELLVKGIEAILRKGAAANPGRVTLRRLNRVEYANTVRDLTGVDFNPAEDFPSDDIGHGFDNIGDVLTLPPVLMERYLASAEAIMDRVFPVTPPKPREDRSQAKYLEPAGRNVSQDRFRPVDPKGGDPVSSGPLHRQYRVEAEGEYTFGFRAHVKEEPVKVAILASGKRIADPAGDAEVEKLAGAALKGLRPFRILSTHEISSKDPRKPDRIETAIPPTPGIDRLAVALFKDAAGPVWIENFALVGPKDPRPVFQRKVMAAVAGKPPAEQAKEAIRDFAGRAFRRPLTDAELKRLSDKAGQILKSGGSVEAALHLVFQVVLCSPKFLFRMELDDRPAPGGARALDEYALASRLSYFLWSSMPDEELLGLAKQGKLAANLDAQVRRLLKDPRSASLVQQFGLQWLQLQRFQGSAPDPAVFPNFRPSLKDSMLRETELLLETVFREDRPVLELISADYTFLNERLARHYQIGDTVGNPMWGDRKQWKPGGQQIRGDAFVKVQLQGPERGGLLAQGSILTVTSNPTRTSPVKRGKWVLEQLMGAPPPPPPPDAPQLEEIASSEAKATLRQRLEEHRKNPTCANCHTKMDAIGFAMENFDAVGVWRTTDGKFPVDALGVFQDGTRFNGVAELKKTLLERKEAFVRCLAEKLLIFALGRGLEPYDEIVLDRLVESLAKADYRFSELAVGIAKSDPFRLRRATP